MIPIIAGIGYELLKLSAKHEKSLFVRTITKPGLWVQKLTTARPSKKQIEVAIAALSKVK